MERVQAATDQALANGEGVNSHWSYLDWQGGENSHCSDLAGGRNLNLKEWGFWLKENLESRILLEVELLILTE